jgi:hypothetical protein
MIRSLKILAVVAAALMAMPAAMATWYSFGSFEPDYEEDAVKGLMWREPPGFESPGKQVYFNVYVTSTEGQSFTGVNPNVGLLETRFDATGNQYFTALLGVWRDCNGDGYIGLAESAVHEYRVELGEHDPNVCPVERPPVGHVGPYATHNDGTWIVEFNYIGNQRNLKNEPTLNSPDKRIYIDHDAMIWGDAGLPGENLAETGTGATCPLSPQPVGSTQSTGGLNQRLACNLDHGAEWNELVATVDSEDSLGLALEDEDNWNEPGHPLNVPTLGNDHSDNAIVTVWDCSSPAVVSQDVGDTHIRVRGVSPSVSNPGGTVAGTINATMEGSTAEPLLGSEECNYSDDNGGDAYPLEGEHEPNSATDKRSTTYVFGWEPMARGGAPSTPLGATSPQDLGTVALKPFFGTTWGSRSVAVGSTPAIPARSGLVVNTTDPSQSAANPQLGANPEYYTFYAYVGDANAGLVLPGAGTNVYGSEWCGTSTSGTFGGFNCDADLWNRNADGSEQSPTGGVSRLNVPGDQYNLRDIDCYDSSVQGMPASTC